MFITVIIPCYNEKNTIKEIVNKVNNYNDYKKEIIIVDDGSTDGTREILEKEIKQNVYKIIYHEQNLGKGAAINSALNHVNGEVVIITENGLESIKPFPKIKERPCIFEYIYFSRPDSIIKNISV